MSFILKHWKLEIEEFMINHKYKFIFIHIPKCAGSSIKRHFFPDAKVDWRLPNYEVLYGWCPKRKIHLQHATSQQLLETELISEEVWKSYFKFTFVRNPWDRAYSDYLWIMSDRKLKGSFNDYISKMGVFKKCMRDNNNKEYRGDHLIPQTKFYSVTGDFKMDFIGRFENLTPDLSFVNKRINFPSKFNSHEKHNTQKLSHYSLFYNKERKGLVDHFYADDIQELDYTYEDKRTGLWRIRTLYEKLKF